MHGGKREGSGRKPGSKTTKTAEIALAAAEKGLTPIEYLLSVMRDEANAPDMRLEAAKSAAPYVHPKLAAIEVSGNEDKPLKASLTVEFIKPDAGAVS